MAIIVNNDTYQRVVYDPEDIEPIYLVDGKKVDIEKVGELAEAAEKAGRKLDLDISQEIKEGAKPITVTFKPLRAKDKTAIEDTVVMAYGETSGQMAPGSMRRLTVQRAVVKWDHEVAFTENVLDNLDPGVFEQIYGWVSWGVAPREQNPETGLPVEDPIVEPNRAQRRAAPKTKATETENLPILEAVATAS